MFCTHCGKQVDEAKNFCKNCGSRQMTTKKQQEIILWPRYITIGLLVLAIFPWPYGYYLLLRVVVFFVFGYYFFTFRKRCKSSGRELPPWVWVIGGLALLFNPFIPAHLFRLLWAVFNIAGAYVLYKSIEWEKQL